MKWLYCLAATAAGLAAVPVSAAVTFNSYDISFTDGTAIAAPDHGRRAPGEYQDTYVFTLDTAGSFSGSLSTQQAAPCWLVLSNDERFAFVANAGSGSIGGFAVSPDGVLTPLSSDGRTGVTNGSGATNGGWGRM